MASGISACSPFPRHLLYKYPSPKVTFHCLQEGVKAPCQKSRRMGNPLIITGVKLMIWRSSSMLRIKAWDLTFCKNTATYGHVCVQARRSGITVPAAMHSSLSLPETRQVSGLAREGQSPSWCCRKGTIQNHFPSIILIGIWEGMCVEVKNKEEENNHTLIKSN